MRLVLAAMPWQVIQRPSLPVGLLHSLVNRDCPDIDVAEYHGSIRWGEYLHGAMDWATITDDYIEIAENGVFRGLGDLIFSGSLYDDPGWRLEALQETAETFGLDGGRALTMRSLSDGFVTEAAEEILASDPDVVGFTSTFTQNVASLALARRLKAARPGLLVVFGGANCEGPMGHALHRNHRFVDYVVRGEAEEVFPVLLDRIRTGNAVADVPGICWWEEDRSVANPAPTKRVPPSIIPIPDFDGWQVAFEASQFRAYLKPELVVESSRGCWWGEKHHCTFCGLNGSLMAFRSKSADQFWIELRTLVERHQVLDITTVDNILDMAYFRSLLPRMVEADWDLRIHFDVKSNLRTDQIAELASAGIVKIQPGVENLSTRVLDLMDKGVNGATNVRVLRDCEDHQVTVDWNYLYGFPGEQNEDYRTLIEQMPALVHLQPPAGESRIVLERFNVYFEQPDRGFAERRPSAFYRDVYDLPVAELTDLAYFFDCEDAGIAADQVAVLEVALGRWRRDYPDSFLVCEPDGLDLVVQDRRAGWPHRDHRLAGWHAVAYSLLHKQRTADVVAAELHGRGHDVEPAEVRAWLEQALADGLVFVDDGRWVGLATSTWPLKMPAVAADVTPEPVGVSA